MTQEANPKRFEELFSEVDKFFKKNDVETTVRQVGDEYFRVFGKCRDGITVYVSVLWGEAP